MDFTIQNSFLTAEKMRLLLLVRKLFFMRTKKY